MSARSSFGVIKAMGIQTLFAEVVVFQSFRFFMNITLLHFQSLSDFEKVNMDETK